MTTRDRAQEVGPQGVGVASFRAVCWRSEVVEVDGRKQVRVCAQTFTGAAGAADYERHMKGLHRPQKMPAVPQLRPQRWGPPRMGDPRRGTHARTAWEAARTT